MIPSLYLPRVIISERKTYSEADLLASERYVVVLAEPGAGKTELLNSLAQQLNTSPSTANVFRYRRAAEDGRPLIIDAFDELAKLDNSGVHEILIRAEATNPTHVYLSSRSSEWHVSSTKAFLEIFGREPLIVRLREFDENDQRSIFDGHVTGADFDAFVAEVSRFDLQMLLPNPQFLKLFADAYIEAGCYFSDKKSIFTRAVERLAREANEGVVPVAPLYSNAKKTSLSSEIFAKLLLSGAEGVSVTESQEETAYPMLASLFSTEAVGRGILATRLFKPGDRPDHHRPVHKIIAEYCAAEYLVSRIGDPADTLSWSKCLPIIAPNSMVRDELRGLLGWMASLGSKTIEEAAIRLDPYGVMANGDPSFLDPSSKRLLIDRLKAVEARDPYFRRGDLGRHFSTVGFFTPEVVEDIQPILLAPESGHLLCLVLELIAPSKAADKLQVQLAEVCFDFNQSLTARTLASRCLTGIGDRDHLADLTRLIDERSGASLAVAADLVEELNPCNVGLNHLSDFLRACVELYPRATEKDRRVSGSRYFITRLIWSLDSPTVAALLDDLTRGLGCSCALEPHECYCISGICKVVSVLLDRYFSITNGPHDPERVWTWMRGLRFHGPARIEQNASIKALHQDTLLRQGIIRLALGHLRERQDVLRAKSEMFGWYSHSGLQFNNDDYEYIVDLAYAEDNPGLWSAFIARHYRHYGEEVPGTNKLRRHMREQANSRSSLMHEWAVANRSDRASAEATRMLPSIGHRRRMAKTRSREKALRARNIEFFLDNRDLIASGKHWTCLVRFADLVLMLPTEIENEFQDEALVRGALRSCLPFIAPFVPSISELAELRCKSMHAQAETILYAACVETIKETGSLSGIPLPLLQALRVGIDVHYDAVSLELRQALKVEVDRLLYENDDSLEIFVRQFIEPQLADHACDYPSIDILCDDPAFSKLKPKLSIEWLSKFPDMSLNSMDKLFEAAIESADRSQLSTIIKSRSDHFLREDIPPHLSRSWQSKRDFWLLRAWFFLPDPLEGYWKALSADRESVHLLYGVSGRMRIGGGRNNWPNLSATKIEAVLDAYIGRWPKVYLPSSWGTSSPKEESAYRFLRDVIWSFKSDDSGQAFEVLGRLISDTRFVDMHKDLKSIRADIERAQVLREFSPPVPGEIVSLLDRGAAITVEGLRQLVLDELQVYQLAIAGSEFNLGNRFYDNGKRLDEEPCTLYIAERLSLRLESQGISVVPEHQLKSSKRSDFTVSKVLSGRRRLLVAEVKGQWHRELYSAAAAQLRDRYSIHQDAEGQGLFIVIWYGTHEKVAGRIKHGIQSAAELKARVESEMPSDLLPFIDVFVLDVSRP